MQNQAVFDITVSETYTEEAVTVTIKATSPSSAQSYGDVLATQMPSQTIDCGDMGLNETEWFCSEVRLTNK
ncbi:hypothetical protein [Alteromonas naphthalenivorans]|uniref:Uncharacterized protein n=1 Tax=Alteromonas naphthalenivorans TaxID=715451 RepID=F5Z5K9_ALTNA|nr:hypothetical protein [Alteromonas naphthalenivorans]AEF05014.1 hypothetical protein ambt_17560 [Alteromonas naphthalenivorans]